MADQVKWIKPTVMLCAYGFFTYVKPSEPFITPYLMGPRKNFTEEEVVNAIYPVWIYSYLGLLLPVFLLTDFVKYKPVIILQGIGYISCWVLLVFAQGVGFMQLMQFCYGVATAGEIGYFSYIYSVVQPEYYQKVTSYVRAITLFGRFFGSLLAQTLVSVAKLDLIYLNVISLVNVSIGFLIALFLPMPKRTLFFYASPGVEGSVEQAQNLKKGEQSDINEEGNDEEGIVVYKKTDVQDNDQIIAEQPTSTTMFVLKSLWKDIKVCYTNTTLLRWSAWWALSTCGWILVVNYVQNLWESIKSSNHGEMYNGAVECLATVLGGCGAVSVGYIHINWSYFGEVALGLCSLLKCGLLMLMYWTNNIWICYVAYVLFIFLYNFVITITQFQIAIGLTTKRFALVFGSNTFFALALNTLLTVVLIDRVGLALQVKTLFIIYSGYFGFISVVFLGHGIFQMIKVPRMQIKSSDENRAS